MEAKSKQKLWTWVSLSSEKNNSNFLLQHIRETLNKFLSKIVTEPKTGKWVQRGHLYETNKMSKLFQDHQLTKTTAFKLETVSLIAFVLKSTLLQKVCEVLPRVTFLAWKWWTLPGGPRKVGHNTSVGRHTHWPSRGQIWHCWRLSPRKGMCSVMSSSTQLNLVLKVNTVYGKEGLQLDGLERPKESKGLLEKVRGES